MKKKPRRPQDDDGSIVPVLEGEEKRLAQILSAARTEADRRLAAAEREAAAELAAVKSGIPEIIREERAKRMVAIDQQAAEIATRMLREAEGMEITARTKKPEAVRTLVGALFERHI